MKYYILCVEAAITNETYGQAGVLLGGSAHKLFVGLCDPQVRHKSNQIDSKSTQAGSTYSLGSLK